MNKYCTTCVFRFTQGFSGFANIPLPNNSNSNCCTPTGTIYNLEIKLKWNMGNTSMGILPDAVYVLCRRSPGRVWFVARYTTSPQNWNSDDENMTKDYDDFFTNPDSATREKLIRIQTAPPGNRIKGRIPPIFFHRLHIFLHILI